MSFIEVVNNDGPSTEPWGIPDVAVIAFEMLNRHCYLKTLLTQ